ncbi:MAG: hypothetical protein DMG05_07895 [Acidobacteria bacterium]|nr:MAG: hypothetical protein DMG05_07895 [Acidobacteriota bacterium]
MNIGCQKFNPGGNQPEFTDAEFQRQGVVKIHFLVVFFASLTSSRFDFHLVGAFGSGPCPLR